MNISNPCLQLMSFTYVMCLLDYLIMFIFPDDVTDRCLLEYSKVSRDPGRCSVSSKSYKCCSIYRNSAPSFHICLLKYKAAAFSLFAFLSIKAHIYPSIKPNVVSCISGFVWIKQKGYIAISAIQVLVFGFCYLLI